MGKGKEINGRKGWKNPPPFEINFWLPPYVHRTVDFSMRGSRRRMWTTRCRSRRSKTSQCWELTVRSSVTTSMFTGWLRAALMIPMTVSVHSVLVSSRLSSNRNSCILNWTMGLTHSYRTTVFFTFIRNTMSNISIFNFFSQWNHNALYYKLF